MKPTKEELLEIWKYIFKIKPCEDNKIVMKPFELYLLILGEKSVDYSYTPEIIYEHIDYFKKCWESNLSTYKALEFFSFELDEKIL